MKKLLVILMIATGCAKEVTQPSEETEVITYHQGRGEWVLPTDTSTATTPVDTLELCCSYYDQANDHYYFCWTANGECDTCEVICAGWNNNEIDDSGKRTEQGTY